MMFSALAILFVVLAFMYCAIATSAINNLGDRIDGLEETISDLQDQIVVFDKED